MAAAATPAPATEATAPSKKQPVVKPERPDEEAFKKAEAAAKKAHEAAQKELVSVPSRSPPFQTTDTSQLPQNAIKAQLDSVKPGGKNPRQQEIKDELAKVRSQVAAKKAARQKVEDAIKALQDSINARVKELNTKRGNMAYRSLADLEAAVAKLDRDVSSGTMKLVEEKKALQEIGNLNKQKKNFAVFDEAQKSIDADRLKLKEMKEKKQDPELKELNEKYDALDQEFKALKAEQDSM
jgi:hypothetical protein